VQHTLDSSSNKYDYTKRNDYRRVMTRRSIASRTRRRRSYRR
jgi:hypothetical protein